MKGLFVRSEVKWIENGGKPTKYFLSLEKRKGFWFNNTLLSHQSYINIVNLKKISLKN